MNVQRWLALGLGVLTVACIATNNLWLTPLMEDDDPTPTPTATTAPEEIAESDLELTATVTPTLNPIVEEMLAESGAAGVGDQPFIVFTGDFGTIDSMHQAVGTAAIWQIGDSKYVLRLDPFTTTNGPDLHVYLARTEAPRTSTETLDNSLDLGALESPTAVQNFEIPPGTRLQDYKSVVIYSRSLNLVFSTAKLSAVAQR